VNTNDIAFTNDETGVTGNGWTVKSVTFNVGTTAVAGTAGNTAPAFAGGDVVAGNAAETSGTSGYTNVAVINITPSTPGEDDQLASTTLNLTGKLTDGAKITLGNKTYTIAVGEDSAFTGAENAVKVDKDADEDTIAAALTRAAKGNDVFSVGHEGGAKITLKQLDTAKESTDMSTMDKFAGYIKVAAVDASDVTPVEGKALTLQIGDTSASYNQLGISIGDMHVAGIGIEDINIANQEDAQAAVSVIKDAINKVSSTRGDLGAIQNRLEHTSNNLSVMSENIQDAESTIRDTDIAEEMMAYTKNNILVQSAQAMLAQANQVPQGVLQLLQ
jgi:flagellin